jgi:hypothetical protein
MPARGRRACKGKRSRISGATFEREGHVSKGRIIAAVVALVVIAAIVAGVFISAQA